MENAMFERARVSNAKTRMKGVARMRDAIVRRVLLPKRQVRMRRVVERAAALRDVAREDGCHSGSHLLSGGCCCCPGCFEWEFIMRCR